jgi:hypothetical protein
MPFCAGGAELALARPRFHVAHLLMESAMERKQVYEADVASFGVLLGVVAAAFIALGVIIYFFGEDQSGTMSAANSPPTRTERSIKTAPVPAEPSTVGQSGPTNK